MMIRVCTICGHGEHHHFQLECAGKAKWACYCPGFCARELSKAEWDIVTDEIEVARGIVNSNEVADDYSEIRRHLGKVMEEASAR